MFLFLLCLLVFLILLILLIFLVFLLLFSFISTGVVALLPCPSFSASQTDAM